MKFKSHVIFNSQDAVREGNWKFFRDGEVRRLFDLSVDQHEQADFSQKHPEVLQRLMREFDKWNDQARRRDAEEKARVCCMPLRGTFVRVNREHGGDSDFWLERLHHFSERL